MIRALSLLCIFAPAAIYAEFSILHENPDAFSYVNVASTLAAAQEKGWVSSELPPDILEELSSATLMVNKHGKSFGMYYNQTTGNCMGAHFGVDKSTISDVVYDLAAEGFSTWVTTVNDTSVEYWYTAISFGSGESSSTPSHVSVIGFDGKLTEISTILSENTNFVKQNCAPGYGTYYFYNLTSTMECTLENMFPWYFLADNDGKMNAFGWYIIGKQTVSEGKWRWTVDWPNHRQTLSEVLTDYPTCFSELASNTGFFGCEFFFMNDPSTMTCS